jgi:hypothetical protein
VNVLPDLNGFETGRALAAVLGGEAHCPRWLATIAAARL